MQIIGQRNTTGMFRGKGQSANRTMQLIEQLDAVNRTNIMRTHIRLTTEGNYGNDATTCIEARDGTIIMEKGENTRWYEYIGNLYNENIGEMAVITPESETPIEM